MKILIIPLTIKLASLKASTATCPMKRIGEPDEIAGAAVFLASEAGSFVNGHTLVIDGGSIV